MTREIKFRAWDKKLHKQVDYFQLDSDGNILILSNMKAEWERAEDNRYILMQYTGLLDNNGKEIYESDVVSSNDGSIGYIVFDDGFYKTKRSIGLGGNLSGLTDYIKVIGNIRENSDLLTKD